MIRPTIALKLAIGIVSAAALASCGLRGDVKRPPPMIGNPPIDGPDDPRIMDENRDAPLAPSAKPAIADPAAERLDTFDEETPDDELLGG